MNFEVLGKKVTFTPKIRLSIVTTILRKVNNINWHRLSNLHVECPFPAHFDLYQIVRPSSNRRKWRCFFQDRDLTFLRVDPAIIRFISGSSWMPACIYIYVHVHINRSVRDATTLFRKTAEMGHQPIP